MKTYETELALAKAKAYQEGATAEQWMLWSYQSLQVIKWAGFRSPEEVYRAANNFGKRVR